MNILSRCIGFGVIVVGLTFIVSAQDQRPPEPPMAPHKVEQYKKMRLIEEMHLDEETSIRFFTRYNKQMNEIKEIQRRRNAIIKQLKELTQANAQSNEIESAVRSYVKLDAQIADVRAKFIEGLKDIFSPKQIAEYLVFEQKFNQNLREVIRDMTRERMGHMQ
jgi:hypothetical protein